MRETAMVFTVLALALLIASSAWLINPFLGGRVGCDQLGVLHAWVQYFPPGITVLIVTYTITLVMIGFVFRWRTGPRLFLVGASIGITVMGFAGIYYNFGLKEAGECVDRQAAFYFSMVTFTTLGYGDIAPTKGLRLIASTQAVIGYIYLGMIVGLASSAAGPKQ